jgi:hypothetical protein
MTSENYATPEEVEAIRDHARRLAMFAPVRFWTMPIGELVGIYNGCGPDSWTDSMRWAATWVYRNFRAAIAIHDFRFEFSDGTRAGLAEANGEFQDNGQIEIESRYPIGRVWMWPVRAAAWGKLRFACVALENGSWQAWQAAHERLSERS